MKDSRRLYAFERFKTVRTQALLLGWKQVVRLAPRRHVWARGNHEARSATHAISLSITSDGNPKETT